MSGFDDILSNPAAFLATVPCDECGASVPVGIDLPMTDTFNLPIHCPSCNEPVANEKTIVANIAIARVESRMVAQESAQALFVVTELLHHMENRNEAKRAIIRILDGRLQNTDLRAPREFLETLVGCLKYRHGDEP